MRLLSLLFLLVCSAELLAQADSVHSSASVVRCRLWNPGGTVNGLNIYFSARNWSTPSPERYRVNGLDLAITGYVHTINGVQFSIVHSQIEKTNGVAASLLFSDFSSVNGVACTGLIALSTDTIRGLQLCGLSHVGGAGRGVGISGLTNVYDEGFSGFMLSGVYNKSWKNMNGCGLTAGVQLFEEDANGFAVSGIGTRVNEGTARGVFISGLFFQSNEDLSGLSIAPAWCRVKGESHGVQISAINTSGLMQGVQIGLFNSTRRLQGVQLGLININRANPKWCRVLPIVNFNFRTIKERDTVWQNGHTDYILKTYYDDGTLASVKQFKAGLENGEQTYYNTFGDKTVVVPYINGKRDGVENRYDGSGNILETVHWKNDSAVRTAVYDYPNAENIELRELMITESDKKRTAVLFFSDTLYSFANEKGKVRMARLHGVGTVVSLFSNDTAVAIYWLPIGSDGKHIRTDYMQVYPAAVDSIYLGNPGDGDVIVEFIQEINSARLNMPSNDALVVSATRSASGIQYCTYRWDSLSRQYRVVRSLSAFSNGVVRIVIEGCEEKIYYANGQLKSDENFFCKQHDTNAEIRFQRKCYYANGVLAVYDSTCMHRFYFPNGKLQCEHGNDKSFTFYSNGIAEYEVSADSLIYNDSKGHVKLMGFNDTLYYFGKSGRIEKRIELHRDTVMVITYSGSTNGNRFDTLRPNDFFRTEIGRTCMRVIRDEPVPPHIATDCSECEDGPHYSNADWFGAWFSLYMTEDDAEEWWSYDDPPEFWTEEYPW